jgi:hypothetical protein
MKKYIFILLISQMVGLFVFVPTVFAHTLKIDGNMGINLHIDPDDAPVAGMESKFLLDIQDKSGRFNPNNPSNCDCVLTIFQNGVVLKTLPVIAGGTYAQLRFTFPTSGVYQVVVEGKPKGEGVPFQAFRTTFEYFIKPGNAESPYAHTQKNVLYEYAPYVGLAVGLLIILMFVL